MAKRILPTQEYLLQCLNYDPDSGVLRWKQRPLEHFRDRRVFNIWNARFPHAVAGCKHSTGYVFLSLDDRKFKAHRIIWRMVTGEEPEEVDHRDTDRANNRWDNLREASRVTNIHNSTARSSSTTGLKGVSLDKRRGLFAAYLTVNKHRRFLGYFTTPEEAKRAYDDAARTALGTFARS